MAQADTPGTADMASHENRIVYFIGGRHEKAGMPLEALQELSVFQELLVEVARQEWKEQHEGKSPPSDVASSVELRLERIHDSSTVPIFIDRASLLPDTDTLDRARDGLVRLLAFVEEKLRFPDTSDAIRTLLRKFGRTLQGNEQIVVSRPDGSRSATYTKELRVAALAASRTEVRPSSLGHVLGSVVKNEPSKGKFEFHTIDGRTIDGFYADDTMEKRLASYLCSVGEAGAVLKLSAGWSHIGDGVPVKILDVTDVQFIFDGDAPWGGRLRELGALSPGWLSGAGESIAPAALKDAAKLLKRLRARTDALPGIFPTPEGYLQLEYPDEGSNLEVTVSGSGTFDVYYLNLQTDEEVDEESLELAEAESVLKRWLHG